MTEQAKKKLLGRLQKLQSKHPKVFRTVILPLLQHGADDAGVEAGELSTAGAINWDAIMALLDKLPALVAAVMKIIAVFFP